MQNSVSDAPDFETALIDAAVEVETVRALLASAYECAQAHLDDTLVRRLVGAQRTINRLASLIDTSLLGGAD